MPKLRSSRRVAGLKESDYDHAIDLVDHDSPPASPRPLSNGASNSGGPSPRRSGERQTSRAESSSKSKQAEPVARRTSTEGADGTPQLGENARRGPSIEIQEATPHVEAQPQSPRNSLSNISTVAADSEPVIDLLYENERGGFLCGVPLFSSRALGNLDPTPWTNVYHKASPTDIHTAQVPDPTWEWAWPEWRIHHHDDVDEGGWEYSFMFSRKFSWHGPQWWNSFVRRRIWLRKRVKRKQLNITASGGTDPHMLNADYFSVRPASERSRSRSVTQTGTSARGSGVSGASAASDSETPFSVLRERIGDVESLMYVLRRARIDREKVEAVGTYLEQGTDLGNLQGRMHDIMRIFIFQTSRKMLLANLTQLLDETIRELEKGGSPELEGRKAYLEGAVRCADEEVRRLAYWSDIKGMVEGGESARGVAEGWGGEWEGVDQSGPAPPRKEDQS